MELHPYFNIACTLMVSAIFVGVDAQSCTKIDACSCTYGSNQVVDLSPLQGNPKWADQWDANYLNMYSYNPCKGFTEGQCNDVAVCQFDGANYYECGSQDSAVFENDPTTGDLIVSYSSTDSTGTVRTSRITLTCTQGGDDVFAVTGETSTALYVFQISSPHCCPKSGPSPSGGGSSGGGISPGSILVIVFFTLIIVYFVAGILFNKMARNAQGSEIVPNKSFWGAIPGLIKDGTLFVVRRGKGSYTEI